MKAFIYVRSGIHRDRSMRAIIFINCDSLAFADGREIAELSDILHRLADASAASRISGRSTSR